MVRRRLWQNGLDISLENGRRGVSVRGENERCQTIRGIPLTEVGDGGMELGERDPNRCEILFAEHWPSLVGEMSTLFEVLCRRSEEANGYMRGRLKESGTIRTYDD